MALARTAFFLVGKDVRVICSRSQRWRVREREKRYFDESSHVIVIKIKCYFILLNIFLETCILLAGVGVNEH